MYHNIEDCFGNDGEAPDSPYCNDIEQRTDVAMIVTYSEASLEVSVLNRGGEGVLLEIHGHDPLQ